MMRIITGSARGVKLETPPGEDTTRPTSERLKEALFSMIQFDIEGRTVLDLFGGSGQLGLEALSRGAASCTFIDSSREVADVIIGNAKNCKLFDKCRISAMDALAYLKSAGGKQGFDIIFLDPPYASGLIPRCLGLISDGDVLNLGGTVCVETAEESEGKKKKKLSPSEESALILETVFGGDEVLFGKYSVKKSSVYGKSRLTLLEAAE